MLNNLQNVVPMRNKIHFVIARNFQIVPILYEKAVLAQHGTCILISRKY